MTIRNKNQVRDRARMVVIGLLSELEAVCGNAEALTALGDVIAGRAQTDDARIEDQINATWQQVTSLPSRIDSMQKLAEAMRALGMTEGAG